MFGIQSTNGANIHFKPGYGTGVGVFPIQAYLNHSCKSNTDTMEHPVDHSVHLYARTAIPAGTQLTTSYLQSSLPTRARRTQLFNTWNFWCSCPACQDSTEGGTFMSGGSTSHHPYLSCLHHISCSSLRYCLQCKVWWTSHFKQSII